MESKKARLVVSIWEKPETREKFEGRAELIRRDNSIKFPDIERWTVRFRLDGFVCDRWVNKKDIAKAKAEGGQ